ncbi:hypothetical protein NDA11_000397 [Ustilago hordei]|uniref:Related to Type I protein geranylgeranyltransferase beta subunit n=1 Tax=Ustilago hordei TaxID=120017 RepID=I2FVJ3_USTHO|nr:uncharacterized protein UHO2_04468 [Ustilago hordei]KAJ1042415.1 hypothetical protein NDA10_003119 [Ustilago hordei]KAJ1577974.1 hypothetical protein NDA12_000502 [Ustilago hordei]KAJ1578230.1 hypothetical protein NDA11_000397 [Ustilago hordei]KAJ1592549.1 hypothetical protein NDA15_005432 [Ustilago hordei]KAJ1595704.1 hypothetical protein NDA14_000323 [Ustilago hordei]
MLLNDKIEVKRHVSFLLRCLHLLPQPYTSADDQRMTLGYFTLASLDLLSCMDRIPRDEREELLNWVYAQQSLHGGFRGGPSTSEAGANVAMTYSALLILAILKDDFERLDRVGLQRYIGSLQDREGGGFAAEEVTGTEKEGKGMGVGVDRDPRFTYCAIAICSMLGEWSSIDIAKAREYLEGCQRYDGGFGASGMHESHSGMTYCCVAALSLLPSSTSPFPRQNETLSWIIHRQVSPSPPDPQTHNGEEEEEQEEQEEQEELGGGFQGRPSKLPADVCYSFWNGAALSILSHHSLIDAQKDTAYVLSAQSRVGGISKVPGEHPDSLHTYLGLASLSLHQPAEGQEGVEFGMKRLDAAYSCSLEAKAWIQQHLTT